MVLEETRIMDVARRAVLDKRKVRIMPVHDEQITPFYVTPSKSSTLRDYEYGSEFDELKSADLTWMKKVYSEAKRSFVDADDAEATESIPIHPLETFDCSRVKDAGLFLVLATTGELAPNKGLVNPDHHMFYVEDKEAEAIKTISSLEKKRKCWDYIDQNISIEDLPAYFKLIKHDNPDNLSKDVMVAGLQMEAEKNPADVFTVFNDEKLPYKLLVQKLVVEGTIQYNSYDSVYKSGDMVIGSTLEEVVTFMLKEENAALRDQWAARVNIKK